MAWRITGIEVSNFKFFHLPFSIETKGCNALIFGENGAGKSSLYWSLYTHFQALEKTEGEVAKYFDPTHSENLLNRFASPEEHSGIKIICSEKPKSEDPNDFCTIEESVSNHYASDTAHPELTELMRKTVITSDFINYRLIAELFDFPNSQPNEIFSILEKELFPIIDLSTALKKYGEEEASTSNAEQWWKYISTTFESLPKNVDGSLSVSAPEYVHLKERIEEFNTGLNLLLTFIINEANSILNNKLGIDEKLDYDFWNVKFNEPIDGGEGKRSGKLEAPKIVLKANLTDPDLKDSRPVYHLRSFFNEAKISCMGIAFRLAALKQRTPVDEAPALLVIDDLLISLDMSVRMKVIPLLLEFQESWQMLILTHDRNLYHTLRCEIGRNESELKMENEIRKERGEDEVEIPEWKWYEVYGIKKDGTHISPYIFTPVSYLDSAFSHFKECRIPECANALRRFLEKELKRILPSNTLYQYLTDYSEQEKKDLNGLISAFGKFVRECNITPLVALHSRINRDRKLVLNPFSHDDLETPFYREELAEMLKELPKLQKVNRTELFPKQDIRKKKYKLSLSKTETAGTVTSGEVEFRFVDGYYNVAYDGTDYYNNPRILVLSKSEGISDIATGNCYPISKVFDRLRHFVYHNTSVKCHPTYITEVP